MDQQLPDFAAQDGTDSIQNVRVVAVCFVVRQVVHRGPAQARDLGQELRQPETTLVFHKPLRPLVYDAGPSSVGALKTSNTA